MSKTQYCSHSGNARWSGEAHSGAVTRGRELGRSPALVSGETVARKAEEGRGEPHLADLGSSVSRSFFCRGQVEAPAQCCSDAYSRHAPGQGHPGTQEGAPGDTESPPRERSALP